MSGYRQSQNHESVRRLLSQSIREACRDLTPINLSNDPELKRQILKRIREGYYDRSEIISEIMDQIELICGNRPK